MSFCVERSGVDTQPAELLMNLIRFNTTNPPGNEAECIRYIKSILDSRGIETRIMGKTPERQNIVARLEGTGNLPPFLMYGHIDVVGADPRDWKYDPFKGVMEEDCIWGRGALDMKGGIAMMLSALLRLKDEGMKPGGDIILAVVCDEEEEGEFGARYLAEEHKHLFDHVRYAIGEIGGFRLFVNNRSFYPIMVSEKQKCTIRMTFSGPTGHGSIPLRNGAMYKLGAILERLNNTRLPVHVTKPARAMVESMASEMAFPARAVMKRLLNPLFTDRLIRILGEKGKLFDSILHNTVNATIVRGGDKINVVPGEITLDLDGRLLPGLEPQELLDELHSITNGKAEIAVKNFIPGPQSIDMGLINTLGEVLKEADKEAIPVPTLISGVTDARYFAKLGIQTYGFMPMKLPKSFDFSGLVHAADERIPMDSLLFGADAIYQLLKRVCRG